MSIKKRKKPCCPVFIYCADAWWRKGLQSGGLFARHYPASTFLLSPLPCRTFFIPLSSASLFSFILCPHIVLHFSLPFSFLLSPAFSLLSQLSPFPLLVHWMVHLSLLLFCSLIPSLCLPHYIPESLLPGPPPLNLWLLWPSSFQTGLLHDLSSLDVSHRRKTGKATGF